VTYKLVLVCVCDFSEKFGIILLLFIIIRPHRRTMYVDAAYCYRLSSVVCLSVTLVRPAKTAALTELLFGLRTRWALGTMY